MDIKNYEKSTGRVIKDNSLFKSQEEALNKLSDWYFSNELECTLIGAAGTGKTFLLKYFIQHIVNKSFTITAPTHKALRQVESATGRKGRTIQNLHGLRPNTDLVTFDIEHPQYDPKGNPSIQNFNLVIIDEGSMINRSIFKLNREASKKYKTKILYVGDELQLPPINEKQSPIFEAVHTTIKLTEIVRQEEGNPLLSLFKLIRYDVRNNKNTFLEYIIKNRTSITNGSGYQLLDEISFKNVILNGFKEEEFIKNIDFLRCTAYTNNTIAKWNSYIRDTFIYENLNNRTDITTTMKEQCKEIIHMNDLLTSYNTIVDSNNSAIITNSEDYIINDLTKYISDENIKTYVVNLQSMYNGAVTQKFLIVDHKDASFKKYVNILNVLHNKAVNDPKLWRVYYKFKETFISLVDFKLPTSQKTVKKDLNYGYALTVHKLQGSTLDNIAIDLFDLVFSTTQYGNRIDRDIELRNKLIYVAMSRARYRAILKY